VLLKQIILTYLLKDQKKAIPLDRKETSRSLQAPLPLKGKYNTWTKKSKEGDKIIS